MTKAGACTNYNVNIQCQLRTKMHVQAGGKKEEKKFICKKYKST